MMWGSRRYGQRFGGWYRRPVRYTRPGCGCLLGRLISGLVALVFIVIIILILKSCNGIGSYYG